MRLDDKTVVIADDDPSVLRLVRACLEPLEDLGAALHEATDGAAAVEQVRRHKPDLVVLDLMMPRLNGFEVCEIIRADRATAHAKIILLTARNEPFDRHHGHLVGADRYMAKPLDPDDLLDEAVRLLGVD